MNYGELKAAQAKALEDDERIKAMPEEQRAAYFNFLIEAVDICTECWTGPIGCQCWNGYLNPPSAAVARPVQTRLMRRLAAGCAESWINRSPTYNSGTL